MKKNKILIIDDEKGFSEMVKLNLESTGRYEVRIEIDSSKAIFEALIYRPDLVLLDIIMAKKEGPEVAMEMMNEPTLKDTPIIFLTATITHKEVEEGEGFIGGHPFVAKPSSLGRLMDAIDQNLVTA